MHWRKLSFFIGKINGANAETRCGRTFEEYHIFQINISLPKKTPRKLFLFPYEKSVPP